jgi:2-oxoglutarate ferredoxin oxidoreductase subunit gamma
MIQIVCSGLGGQGVLTLGLILAELAADQDKHVAWIPSYGSAMRGGVADCAMKIADEEIINPYIETMDLLVALAPQALERYQDQVRPGGGVIVNSSIVKDYPKKDGLKYLDIPANDIALAEDNAKGVSLVIIGAVIANSGMVSKNTGADGVEAYFAKKRLSNPKNRAVFLAGYDAAARAMAKVWGGAP